jgi:Holliday junction DNA helicase RuvA
MIEQLRGTLALSEPGHVVIDCGGVGYGVAVPHSTYKVLPAVGEEARLLVHAHMRESELTLFGFATTTERRLFKALINVQSIGPKLALVLLSSLAPDELVRAIQEGDLTLLTSVPGIGKRTAERLCVELREPLTKVFQAMSLPGATSPAEPEEVVPGITSAMRDQAVQTLSALGTPPAVAARAISKAAKTITEKPSVEALVKEGLRHR